MMFSVSRHTWRFVYKKGGIKVTFDKKQMWPESNRRPLEPYRLKRLHTGSHESHHSTIGYRRKVTVYAGSWAMSREKREKKPKNDFIEKSEKC